MTRTRHSHAGRLFGTDGCSTWHEAELFGAVPVDELRAERAACEEEALEVLEAAGTGPELAAVLGVEVGTDGERQLVDELRAAAELRSPIDRRRVRRAALNRFRREDVDPDELERQRIADEHAAAKLRALLADVRPDPGPKTWEELSLFD